MCHVGSKEQSHMGSSPGPKALSYRTMLLSSHCIKLLVKCNDISLGKYPSYPMSPMGKLDREAYQLVLTSVCTQ